MPGYMRMPQFKLLLAGGTYSYTNRKGISIKTVHVENAFPVATVVMSDPQSRNRSKFCKGTQLDIYVKEAFETTWFHLLHGKVRFATEGLGKNGETIVLKADGQGYGLSEMLVNQEYGTQSENPDVHHLDDVLLHADHGIVPKYVNYILASAIDSGYAFDTTNIDDFTTEIPYLYFPFKPATKCLSDLIDLHQALRGSSAGAHWLVTTADELLVTVVGTHSSYAANKGWTTFINGQSAAGPLSTLIQKRDFIDFNFEDLEEEVNYILYYANCIHPANKDKWTEAVSDDWDSDIPTDIDIGDSIVQYIVNAHSLCSIQNNNSGPHRIWYNITKDLGLDLTALGGKYSIPWLNFLHQHDSDYVIGNGITIYLCTAITDFSTLDVDAFALTLPAGNDNKWTQYSVPVGPYWKHANSSALMNSPFGGWLSIGSPSWSNINAVAFGFDSDGIPAINYIDGLHFIGWVLRGAYNSTKITANDCKMRIVNDPFAKYDSLKASDDSGTVALMAKAELLRGQTTPMICSFKTGMMRNAWPGQLFHAHARANQAGVYQIDKNFRINQITHEISTQHNSSVFAGTDDLINSMSRAAFDSHNEVMKSYRPEFQDRQSSGTKLRDLDITAAILAVDYG